LVETSAEDGRIGPAPVVGVFRREYAWPTETFVVSQVRGLKRYAPVVICRRRLLDETLAAGSGPLGVHAFEDSGVERASERLAYRYLRRPSRRESRWYADVLAGSAAEVVHAHFGTDAGYVLPAVRVAGLPLVVSWYGYDVSQFPTALGGMGRVWLGPVLRNANLHLAMTRHMAAALITLGAPASSVRVHHFGIDCPFWGGVATHDARQPASPALLMVASFVEKKGHMDLIRAFAEVSKSVPECTLRLVGEGQLEGAARGLVRDLGLESRVSFLGFLPHGDELLAEYRRASIYVHPSRTARNGDQEGLPTAILEAMSAGLPVVATLHAGIPEAVRPDSGLLVEQGDVHGLARALTDLLRDPAAMERMGRAGRTRVFADYDLTTQMNRLESIYDEARYRAADGSIVDEDAEGALSVDAERERRGGGRSRRDAPEPASPRGTAQ
jgi:colanic acid/amylovoran biosynthesis glycosyltransferase